MGPHPYSSVEVHYATHTDEKLSADIIRPTDKKTYPGVVLVHGGSWGGRSRDDMTKIGEFIASHGFVVMNVSYRFAPKHRYPAQIEDINAAITWFKQHAGDYQLDTSKIGGWGYSAGGHIISQWALLEGEKNETPALQAVVSGGAPMDLTWYPFSPIITHLLDGFRDQRPKEYKEASPAHHVTQWAPPFFLYHGEKDRLVEAVQSSHMQNLLRDAGVETKLHLVEFWGHIGTFLYAGKAMDEGIVFLKEKLK